MSKKECTKDEFLRFPADHYCSTICSFGPPRSGKTYLALECIKEWLKMGMFEKYVCIIPNFKNEQSDSYGWMLRHENIDIYEKFHAHKLEELIKEQEAWRDDLKKGKVKQMRRVFVFIDDATGQRNLFDDPVAVRLATEQRHICCHSWICLHYAKGVIKPAVRNNLRFVFVYPITKTLLKQFHQDFIPAQWEEFEEYNAFLEYFRTNVLRKEFGCMLIAGKDGYSTNCCDWFKK